MANSDINDQDSWQIVEIVKSTPYNKFLKWLMYTFQNQYVLKYA